MSIAEVFEEGRLIRHRWDGNDGVGRQLLCLYTALVNNPDGRPSDPCDPRCPRWLAHLLPWLNDSGTAREWPAMVRRVAALEPHLATLPPEIEWSVRAVCVREAMRRTRDKSVLGFCERVAAMCDRLRLDRAKDVPEIERRSAEAEAKALRTKIPPLTREAFVLSTALSATVYRLGESGAYAVADRSVGSAVTWGSLDTVEVAVDEIANAILSVIEAYVRSEGETR